MRIATALLIFALWGCASGARLDDQSVTYAFTPGFEGAHLVRLHVTMSLRGDADGQTELALPTSGVADGEAVAYIQSLDVDGAEATPAASSRYVLTHAPGTRIVVRYDLLSGYAEDPRGQPFRPVVRPDWFWVHGEAAFIKPVGRDDAPAQVTWSGFPEAWLAQWSEPPNATVELLSDSVIVGGAEWQRIHVQPRFGPQISFYFRTPGWRQSPADALPVLRSVLSANFEYWEDTPGALFVPVLQVSGGDFGGRGLANGFMIFADADADLSAFTRIFAHEHQHNWISRQTGGFPRENDNLSAWFNEGFAEALSARSLLRSEIWSAEDFVADLNASLLRYGLSPAAEAPNARIQEARGSNPDVNWLAYDRGRLLAIIWDRELRARTAGAQGLDDVLQTQRRLARENEARGVHVPANELFPMAVREATGLDWSEQIARFVENGERAVLRADLFEPCGRVEDAEQPVFDRGFDLEATFRNGRRVTGLAAGGPAARAGLREGDRIRVSEVWSRDSQTPLTYRVIGADGGETIITYKPEGAARVRFQRFVLNDTLSVAERAQCGRLLSGEA